MRTFLFLLLLSSYCDMAYYYAMLWLIIITNRLLEYQWKHRKQPN